MPRNATGTYTLVTGNPVVTGTIVESVWANNTMGDVGLELTDSLSRSGKGGMLAPLRGVNGSASGPTFTFTNYPTSGLYSANPNDVRMAVTGIDRMRWRQAGEPTQFWDNAASVWKDLGAGGTVWAYYPVIPATVEAGVGYISAGNQSTLMPAAPLDGDGISFADLNNDWDDNPFTLNGNGHTFSQDDSSSYIINLKGAYAHFAFMNNQWVIVNFGRLSDAYGYDLQNYATKTFVQSVLPVPNAIINGNFDIWQRATSQTASGYGSDDRWHNALVGSTQVVSRQAFTLGQTDVPNNPKYYSRTVVTSVAGVGNYVAKNQRIEGVEAFAGTTATLSFWAKADASKNIVVELVQVFGTGGSPSAIVTVAPTTVALTTSWVKYTVSVAVPSIASKVLGTNGNDYLQLLLWMDAGSDLNARTNSLGQQSGTFEFSQVQMEAGAVASTFYPRSVGEELALCQRYCYVVKNKQGSASSISSSITTGHCYNTTTSFFVMPLPVTMRATPSILVSFATDFQQVDTTVRNLTNLTMGNATLSAVSLNGTGTGMVAGRGALLRFDGAAYDRYIHVSAEL
tara:strand:- start:43 stop:1749 length:1707 start_codon:yes stop_codon:yes gene_type:complete